jgi:hypothetical protein
MNRTLDDHLQERFRHVLSGLSVFQFPFYYRVGPHFNLVNDLLQQLNSFTVSEFMLQVGASRRMRLVSFLSLISLFEKI